jgi:hypothetical protein
MSAGQALQAALAPKLVALPGLTGLFDGPPPRAPFPYAAIDCGTESDWSHKSGAGREVLVALTLWDDQPARLAALADEAELALGQAIEPAGWSLVSLSFLKRRTVRDAAGPWAVAIDCRARMLVE